MLKELRARLTYANVMATIAVFLALGGGAYAVNGSLAGRNTVGSADIINQEVKSADVENEGITGGDIQNATVTGDDVSPNATLRGEHINESSLAAVPNANFATSIGDGAVTTTKFGTLTRKTASVLVPGGTAFNGAYDTRVAEVSCDPDLAISGSAYWTSELALAGNDELPLIETGYTHNFSGRPTGFWAEGGNDSGDEETLFVAVHCLE